MSYTSQPEPKPLPAAAAGAAAWHRGDGAAAEEVVSGKETGPTVTSLDTLLRGILKALRANGINPTTEESP